MSAIVVARVHVTDPERYERYKPISFEALKKYGGRYLVRGAEPVTLEGEVDNARYVVVEFDSVEAATAFYDSPEYRHARDVRAGASDSAIFVLEVA